MLPQTGLLRQVSTLASSILRCFCTSCFVGRPRCFCCGFPKDSLPCPWLQFTHSPCRSHSDSELGGEDVYHAAELPASQLVCHSLRPETQKERGGMGEGGSAASLSLPPSLALLTFEPVSPPPLLLLYFLSSPAL